MEFSSAVASLKPVSFLLSNLGKLDSHQQKLEKVRGRVERGLKRNVNGSASSGLLS